MWGSAGAVELLEWLGIPPRHQTMRDSMLDVGLADRELDGVVLLDLPDHDSTEVAHHLEVDRLVERCEALAVGPLPGQVPASGDQDQAARPVGPGFGARRDRPESIWRSTPAARTV